MYDAHAVIAAAILLILPLTAWGHTIRFVDDDARPGDNGLSWFEAYNDLQDALAYYPDEIHVAAGTYAPGTERSDSLHLRSGMGIHGGYRGLRGSGNPDERDIAAFRTSLSGDITVDDNSDFVCSSGAPFHAVLDGVAITASLADGDGYGSGDMDGDSDVDMDDFMLFQQQFTGSLP